MESFMGKLVRWFMGTRLSSSTRMAGAWGCDNTLPVSRILRASNYTSMRTMVGCVFDDYLYTGIPSKLRRFGCCVGKYYATVLMRLWGKIIPYPRSLVRATFSEVMGLASNSRAKVGCFSCSQSVVSEMPAYQGRPPLRRRAPWRGHL